MMKPDICSQCHFPFTETPIQFGRRIKDESPKMCRECYRISKAEERAKKRQEIIHSQTQQQCIESPNIRRARMYREINGKINPVFLMRKLRVSHEDAVKICSYLEAETFHESNIS